jgi:hypothetical protein
VSQLIGPSPPDETAVLHEAEDDLLDVKRIASCPLPYQIGDTIEGRVGSEEIAE